MLVIKDLYAGYRSDQPILKGLNLTLENNEKIAIFGQNGAGKSTIGKAIMGLLPFCEGQILFNNQDLTKCSPNALLDLGVAYFMQGGRVFGRLNALENLKAATAHLPKKTAGNQIEQVIEEFDFFKGNTRRTNIQATFLSGGERHQLALAMVFATCPNMKLLIADEVSAGVSKTQRILLLNKIKKTNKAVLLIEQNQELARCFTDRNILLSSGKYEKV